MVVVVVGKESFKLGFKVVALIDGPAKGKDWNDFELVVNKDFAEIL